MRSTRRAIWLLVPDPFSAAEHPSGHFGYWFLIPFSAPPVAGSADAGVSAGPAGLYWLQPVMLSVRIPSRQASVTANFDLSVAGIPEVSLK